MVSLIIPYKNAEKWIYRCINSLKVQQLDMEFIFVSDYDKPVTLPDDERFVLLENNHGPGVSGARNTGIDYAHGEWITFLDADDELVPEASVVFDRMTRLDPTANIIQANQLRYYDKTGRTRLKYPNARGIYDSDNMPHMWCMVWNKLIRKSFIDEHGFRFVEGLQYGEDEIFILEMLAKDDRIFHTKTNTVTTIHHFDNKESLSKIKGADGLISQSHALEEFILRCKSRKIRRLTCKVLSEHWGSPTFMYELGDMPMKYIIMCGGEYPYWKRPKQLTVVNGETLVARTIRLLREQGVKDIAISSNNEEFEQFGVPVLKHDNEWVSKYYDNYEGYWCNAFYPMDKPACYLFGDVVYSPEAIRTIVETETDDIMFFGSKRPFAPDYPVDHVEPFAFKVNNQKHLREACAEVKRLDKLGAFARKPLSWELWYVIAGSDPYQDAENITGPARDYVAINDYTCDIDYPSDAKRFK